MVVEAYFEDLLMKLTIVNQTSEKINTKRLEKALDLCIQSLCAKRLRQKKRLTDRAEIVFVFLTEAQMRKINMQFRGKNKSTDVLSFLSADPQALGELLFCMPVLKKQAKRQGHPLEAELVYMMIHGLLHLLGYDHEVSKSEEKVMFQIQNSCFEQVRHPLW